MAVLQSFIDKICFALTEPVTSDWSPWTTCSVTCGRGTQTRTRKPTRDFDAFLAGKYPLEDVKKCYMDPCPDGKMTLKKRDLLCFHVFVGNQLLILLSLTIRYLCKSMLYKINHDSNLSFLLSVLIMMPPFFVGLVDYDSPHIFIGPCYQCHFDFSHIFVGPCYQC